MPDITVSQIQMDRSEMLLLFFHEDASQWWATIGPQDSDETRACGEGATPAAALGELLTQLGATEIHRPN